jgi:hypothetical protein
LILSSVIDFTEDTENAPISQYWLAAVYTYELAA